LTTAGDYFKARFTPDPRRAAVWRELVRYVSRDIRDRSCILDLGCGYGDFINAVAADRKLALDLNAGAREWLAPDVTFLGGDCADLSALAEASVGTVFASNLLEHVPRERVPVVLGEVRRVLRPGGRVLLIQPNYRLGPARYFDDYTHVTVFSDVSLCDWLRAGGFVIRRCVPGLLPFSMNSPLPKHPLLVRLYLHAPVRPLARQMYVVAERS
jgi:SAM-dependent methyltransferase